MNYTDLESLKSETNDEQMEKVCRLLKEATIAHALCEFNEDGMEDFVSMRNFHLNVGLSLEDVRKLSLRLINTSYIDNWDVLIQGKGWIQ